MPKIIHFFGARNVPIGHIIFYHEAHEEHEG